MKHLVNCGQATKILLNFVPENVVSSTSADSDACKDCWNFQTASHSGHPRTRGRCIHDLQFPRDRYHVQNVLNDQLSCDQRNPIVLVSEDVDYDLDVDMIAYVRGIYRDPSITWAPHKASQDFPRAYTLEFTRTFEVVLNLASPGPGAIFTTNHSCSAILVLLRR